MQSRSVTGLVGLLAIILPAACSDDSTAGPASSDTVIATSTTVHPDDGALVIGAILPNSGLAADLGASMNDALTMGMTEINAAGGINGRRVRLIVREEGDTPATAALAVQGLTQLGVDAIIGPTSSTNTLSTLTASVDAGVLTCGPTPSALALDEFPDDGLFFRTIPSDSLQAQAIASVVEASGSSTAIVVYLDDDYGRPFAEATQEAIIARGTRVSATVAFTANEDSVSAAVEQVLANQPEVVAVIADGASGPAIINAIDAAATTRLTYVVNDAIRRPAPSAQPFSAQLSRKVVGVAPVAYATSPAFTQALLGVDPTTTGLYAHNAYDCLAIIALAAQATGSNQPRDLADAVSTVTTSGTGCTTFIACSAALTEGRNINYNGPIGNLSIGPSGNVTTADFDRFRFDASGRDVSDGTITIGND